MLPPVEASVLAENPDFAALYTTLTTEVLNPDGTTRAETDAKARNTVREELRGHRLKTAKRHLLTSAITTAVPDDKLPEPLLDLLFLLPAVLAHPPDAETTALLLSTPPFSNLTTLLPDLSVLVSRTIHTTALSLARIQNPTTNPSFLHRTIPSLAQNLSTLLSTTQTLSTKTLLTSRQSVTSTSLIPLLETHTQAISRLIHALEAKLSSPQRDILLRAEMLPLSAEESSLRAQIDLARLEKEVVYTPEVCAALENYSRHLRDARGRVETRSRDVGAMLAGYGVAVGGRKGDPEKEAVFREMGRVYGEMRRGIEEVEGDLERLKRR